MTGPLIPSKATGQLETVHLGHHDVGDDEVRSHLDGEAKTCFTIPCFLHAEVSQILDDVASNVVVVLHYEDYLPFTGSRLVLFAGKGIRGDVDWGG